MRSTNPAQLSVRRRQPRHLTGLFLNAMMPLEYIKRKVSPADFSGKFSLFMSNALVKLQRKGQMVIPRSLREEAGVAEGTLLKVAVVKGGQFLVTPQFTIDRSVIADHHKDPKQAFRELAQVVAEIRQEAKEKGIDKMPMSEINAAVAAARKALQKKTAKRRVK